MQPVESQFTDPWFIRYDGADGENGDYFIPDFPKVFIDDEGTRILDLTGIDFD